MRLKKPDDLHWCLRRKEIGKKSEHGKEVKTDIHVGLCNMSALQKERKIKHSREWGVLINANQL